MKSFILINVCDQKLLLVASYVKPYLEEGEGVKLKELDDLATGVSGVHGGGNELLIVEDDAEVEGVFGIKVGGAVKLFLEGPPV